jgi:hypothetical protein
MYARYPPTTGMGRYCTSEANYAVVVVTQRNNIFQFSYCEIAPATGIHTDLEGPDEHEHESKRES